MLKLREVTLVMVETREHQLARMAIEDCLAVAEFGDILILTDSPGKMGLEWLTDIAKYSFDGHNIARFHKVPDWPDKIGWSRSWWFDVPPLLRTSHTLNIQWDSWICDPSMWDDEFLQYDYIGAPWWYDDGKNVGNGGFSLVSTPLKRYIYDRRWMYPCDTPVDDDLLCRKYRPQLQDAGFVWAPEKVAHRFSFECCRQGTNPSFGFHAMMNWPDVLSRDRLNERVQIACKSEYIGTSYMMKAFAQKHPAIIKEILNQEVEQPWTAGATNGSLLGISGKADT